MGTSGAEVKANTRIMALERACDLLEEQVEFAEGALSRIVANEWPKEDLRALRKLRREGRKTLRKAGVIP